MTKRNNHITKVRSRQAVKLPAVQPIVMLTRHWRGSLNSRKFHKNRVYYKYDFGKTVYKMGWWEKPIT